MGKLIDADAIQYTDLNGDHPESKVRVYVAFKENIDRMPTVDAVPVRHGRWIQVSQDRANCNRCNCESGKMIKQGERYFPKFCPECGADMRKDGNDGKAD